MHRNSGQPPAGHPVRQEPDQHISRLGSGGSMLLFTLRQWIWHFSAGHLPPACITGPLLRAGCADVPRALLDLLRLLRGSAHAPLYCNPAWAEVLTTAEVQILHAVATARRLDQRGLPEICAALTRDDEVARAALIMQRIAAAFQLAELEVWSDTALRTPNVSSTELCRFVTAASADTLLTHSGCLQ